MRRALAVGSFFFTVSLGLFGCSGECSRSSDCDPREVCYQGTCRPNSAEYVACDTNMDCDSLGLFECRVGRCELKGSTVVTSTTPDGG
jgi:hypothetical protein